MQRTPAGLGGPVTVSGPAGHRNQPPGSDQEQPADGAQGGAQPAGGTGRDLGLADLLAGALAAYRGI